MGFYQSIAAYYDNIFNFSREEYHFIKSSVGESHREGALLDIGCGTGRLTIELSKLFKRTVGIDLDHEMLEVASTKALDHGVKVEFVKLDMHSIGSRFPESSFDVIVCTGNTLVHLEDRETIAGFFRAAHKLLRPAGKMILQIINYDHIINNNILELPLKENEKIKFVRNYCYHEKRNIIDFVTELTIKGEDRQITNKIELYPLRKAELEELLEVTGFSNMEFYYDFRREGGTKEGLQLVCETRV